MRMKPSVLGIVWAAVWAAVWFAAGPAISAPTLIGLGPAQGATRALVEIAGQDLDGAVVVWDAETPAAKRLPPAMAGAVMFTVPAGATLGAHKVRVERGNQRSELLTFTVTASAVNATPRIDDISLAAAQFAADGRVTATLYVQGANIDVGAQILIDGVVVESQAHRALTTNLYGVAPTMLAYPIDHYLARLVPLPAKPGGSQIQVEVRNEAGELSAKRVYRLPQSAALLDSDGDGLTDVQETQGFNNGNGLVDLKALGTDPYRKDVLLELDVMQNVVVPVPTTQDAQGTLDVARSVFADAPVLSPYGPRGIRLYIDATGRLAHSDFISLWPMPGIADLPALRRDNFTKARRGAFHYAVWAGGHPSNWSGHSNVDFTKGYGDSFFVSLGAADPKFQTVRAQAETLVHELGHNLGQRHGGVDDYQYSPVYLSDMAYTWQLRTSLGADFWKKATTCSAFYYGIDRDELAPAAPPVERIVIDYSQGMGSELTFGSGALDERRGVCGRAFDWDGDDTISVTPVNARPYDPNKILPVNGPVILRDYPNWANLRFDGPAKGIWP